MWIFTMSVPSLRADFNSRSAPRDAFFLISRFHMSSKYRHVIVSKWRVIQYSSHHNNNTVTLHWNSWKIPSIVFQSVDCTQKAGCAGNKGLYGNGLQNFPEFNSEAAGDVTVGTPHSALSSIQEEQRQNCRPLLFLYTDHEINVTVSVIRNTTEHFTKGYDLHLCIYCLGYFYPNEMFSFLNQSHLLSWWFSNFICRIQSFSFYLTF